MCQIGDMKKWGHFFCSFAILDHFYGPFLLQKRPKMPKKGQTWCFQPPFTLTKCTMKPDDKYERSRRYEKMRSFFCSVRSWLFSCLWACFWTCFFDFSPGFNANIIVWPCKCKKLNDAVLLTPFSASESHIWPRKVHFWAILAVFGADFFLDLFFRFLARIWPKKSLFGPAAAKSSPLPFFWPSV